MVITSLENQKVKDWVKLQQKKYRDETGTYLVEGEHLVEEAHKNGCILEVIAKEETPVSYSQVTYVTEEVLKKISTLETPPAIMAVCQKPVHPEIVGNRILLLDDIQDPGNLGTMIRSSLAFGVSTIILSPHSVDYLNPKVIRGTQGMMFHLPIVTMETREAIAYMKEHRIPVYGTSVVGGVEASSLSSEEKESFCLVMGNEGNGLGEETLSLCDKKLYIPMEDKVESLNVGVACSILLYEFRR